MTTAVRLRLLALLIVGADAIISPSAAAAAVRTSLLPRILVPQIYPPPTLSPLTVALTHRSAGRGRGRAQVASNHHSRLTLAGRWR